MNCCVDIGSRATPHSNYCRGFSCFSLILAFGCQMVAGRNIYRYVSRPYFIFDTFVQESMTLINHSLYFVTSTPSYSLSGYFLLKNNRTGRTSDSITEDVRGTRTS
jgi:hypothetical protein